MRGGLNASLIEVPRAFHAQILSAHGKAGERWLSGLPAVIEGLCRLWELSPEGAAMHGNCGVVVPVRRGGRRCALKVSWRDDKTRWEGWALDAWAGRGAVRLLAEREPDGALLLERLDPDVCLDDLPADEAAAVAGTLLRRLSVPVPASPGPAPPRLSQVAEGFAAAWRPGVPGPVPAPILRAARGMCAELGPCAEETFLVDQDLHYRNVLRGAREPWLAIDPKVVLGVPEYGAAPLLWNRFEVLASRADLRRRLDIVIEAAELDRALALGWSLVRAVDYWFWAAEAGTARDRAVAEALASWLAS